jgi:hypothetical protein
MRYRDVGNAFVTLPGTRAVLSAFSAAACD